MRNGKLFEILVKLINDSFRDKPETEIFTRYNMPTKAGGKNNFDVVIKTVVNNEPICIVIECKDHKRKIESKEIGAFESKCNFTEGINKKIFVSKNGFQKGAYELAKNSGIILYQLSDLKDDIIKNWVGSLMLSEREINPSVRSVAVNFKEPNQKFTFNHDTIVGEDNSEVKVRLIDFVIAFYQADIMRLNTLVTNFYEQGKKSGIPNSPIQIHLKPDFSNQRIFLINPKGENCYIDFIEGLFMFTINEILLQPDEAKSYLDLGSNKNKAELFSFASTSTNQRITVIRNPEVENHYNVLVTNKDGGPLDPNFVPHLMVPEGLKIKVEER